MDRWFDLIPAAIWAEHGLWRREAEGHRWRRTQWTTSEWLEDVAQLLEQFVAATPGAFVEKRPNGLAWRFHRADRTFGQSQAQTLAALLRDAAEPLGYEVIASPGLVDVRATGLSLARTVQKVMAMNQAHQVVFVGTARRHSTWPTCFAPRTSLSTAARSAGPGRCSASWSMRSRRRRAPRFRHTQGSGPPPGTSRPA